MKVKGNELFEAIRAVVRDEIKKALPAIVKEHLTETYLRKMVIESNIRSQKKKSPKTVSELMTISDADENAQNIPEPLENSDMGIYSKDFLTSKYEDDDEEEQPQKRVENEGIRKLKKEMGPMSFVFENVKVAEDVTESAPQPDVMEKVGFDFSRMNEVLSRTSGGGQMKSTPEAKMRELEAKRKALEVPVK